MRMTPLKAGILKLYSTERILTSVRLPRFETDNTSVLQLTRAIRHRAMFRLSALARSCEQELSCKPQERSSSVQLQHMHVSRSRSLRPPPRDLYYTTHNAQSPVLSKMDGEPWMPASRLCREYAESTRTARHALTENQRHATRRRDSLRTLASDRNRDATVLGDGYVTRHALSSLAGHARPHDGDRREVIRTSVRFL